MKKEFLVKSKNGEYSLIFNDQTGQEGTINDQKYSLDVTETKTGFHILKDKKGINVDVLNIDHEKKTVELRINQKHYSFELKNKYHELLESLGMDVSGGGKISEIKAPMPGLVLDVMIAAGDEVKADQPMLILEAMKMENVIKSPIDGSIKKVVIKKGESVEKNEMLVLFD